MGRIKKVLIKKARRQGPKRDRSHQRPKRQRGHNNDQRQSYRRKAQSRATKPLSLCIFKMQE